MSCKHEILPGQAAILVRLSLGIRGTNDDQRRRTMENRELFIGRMTSERRTFGQIGDGVALGLIRQSPQTRGTADHNKGPWLQVHGARRLANGRSAGYCGLQQFRANRLIAVDVTDFIELNNDQRREKVNSDQRFAVLKEAQRKAKSFRGSLVWHTVNGIDHLMRSYYDSTGARHQKVEGRRSPASEALKADWEVARASAQETLSARREQMERQSAVNRALRLGRVPLIAARIIRAIDDAGLLGEGIRIAGTNAIYAYEATAGVFVDPGITSTEDIGLLMDARQSLRIMADTNVEEERSSTSCARSIGPSSVHPQRSAR